MPSSSRFRGSGGGSNNQLRTPTVTPMSERQQMALLLQMTSQQTDTSPSRPSPGPSNTSQFAKRDRNERGETALHVAAIKGDLEQLNKLIVQGVDPNVTDFAGWTPLHEACNHGWYAVALALIKAGANVNARGLDDDTPLHDAANNGQLKLVKLLVEKGANPTFKNRKGKSPCDVAAPAVYNYLLSAKDSSPNTNVIQGRLREEKKTDVKKLPSEDHTMENKQASIEDVYDFKTSTKDGATTNPQTPEKADPKEGEKSGESAAASSTEEINITVGSKRNLSESNDQPDETGDEDNKRKKRKEMEVPKESTPKSNSVSRTMVGKSGKTPGPASKTLIGQKVNANIDKKSPCASPKPNAKTDSDVEIDDKTGDAGISMKVPPLKIVIPQSGNTEGDSSGNRTGKNTSQRTHAALPYVVASNSNDSDKDGLIQSCGSPADSSKSDEKKNTNVNFSGALQEDRQQQPRVLRSSYRSGGGQGSVDRSSNNSSPQLQGSVPSSPPTQPPTDTAATSSSSVSNFTMTSTVASQTNVDTETVSSSASTTSTNSNQQREQKEAPVDLHPRKRKIKASKDSHNNTNASAPGNSNQLDGQEAVPEIHPHDQPITNCYQMFRNIRDQIERRQKRIFPVKPKPPQGFKDYLLNRCTYKLAGTHDEKPVVIIPTSLPTQMKDLFTKQEQARYKMKMQHIVEKEKLVLNVEQEILRVHARAARALGSQDLPYSICTYLKDEEVYNLITPEQEEKDINNRSRYNGRLFLSWLQDVDDKWEKIKEELLLRQHNEAESLHAVQKMDWGFGLKEHNLCEFNSNPVIDKEHVPIVPVCDDFDLLPA